MSHVDGTADSTANYGVKGENSSPAPSKGFVQNKVVALETVITGVWGDAPNYVGVTGTSNTGQGVTGTSNTGQGVWGGSQPGPDNISYGRYGFLGGRDPLYNDDAGACGVSQGQGVFGQSTGATGTGVYGNGYYALRGDSPNGTGFIGGIDPKYKQKAGVYGSSDQQGVVGASTGGHGTAVYGDSTDGDAIRAETTTGTAIRGTAYNGGYAAQFNGNVNVTNGNVVVAGDVQLTNMDCAEDFDVMADVSIMPGTVMVLSKDGTVTPSAQAYDPRVAGIISGAGDLKPAIMLGRRVTVRPRVTIALMGTVYCKVDASESAIETGDLLTTSAIEGHAMKAVDRHRAFGAVIGKAMRGLESGRGLIPVLIALQ